LNYIDVIFVDPESANPTHSLPTLTPDLITPTP
jgi:hypothetical protein